MPACSSRPAVNSADRRTSPARSGWADIDGMRSQSHRLATMRSRSPSTQSASTRFTGRRVPAVGTDLDHLRERLEGIAEELADAAIERLRAAVDGDAGAAAEERRLTRARRAVEKAANLLTPD